MPWVYILKTKIGKYYVGSTTNITERLRHHKNGNTPSTREMGFDSCVLTQEYSTLKEARKVELKIKKLKRSDYIDKMVEDGYIKIKP